MEPSRLALGTTDGLSVAELIARSMREDRTILLSFSDGVLHLMLDQKDDWTITVGVSINSSRIGQLTRALEQLGFFHATEEAGIDYHLWTSALGEDVGNEKNVEEILLMVLIAFQNRSVLSYIS